MAKQMANGKKPRMSVSKSVKVRGTSSETTSKVSEKPKTTSLKASMRETSWLRCRNSSVGQVRCCWMKLLCGHGVDLRESFYCSASATTGEGASVSNSPSHFAITTAARQLPSTLTAVRPMSSN